MLEAAAASGDVERRGRSLKVRRGRIAGAENVARMALWIATRRAGYGVLHRLPRAAEDVEVRR
jgi:hypothetical protein